MKDFFNLRVKSKLLLLTLLAMLAGASPTWAQELTVHDGTSTNSYVPIYGNWADAYLKGEFIIPATDLTAIKGKKVSAMKFYASSASKSWNGKFQIFLKEVENTTLSDFSGTTDATTVYEGTLSVASNEMTISFNNEYTYSGGNLLIGFYQTDKGNYSDCSFYGETVSGASITGYNSSSLDGISSTQRNFIPKTTFIYKVEGPATKVLDGTKVLTSGHNHSFGLATAGTKKVFTLSNPGTEAAPISVSHTGSFGAELSANSIPAGGSVTLTVTMPDASGSDVITISSTSDAIDDFVINVSGTIRDESKLWCNFADGLPTGWTNSGSWSIATSGADGATSGAGYAYNTSYGTNKLMYTPLVTIAEGEKLYLMAKGYGATASWNVLKIQYSADGNTWTTAKDLTGITNSWQSIEVTEIPAGNWYIGFYGSYAYFTDIYGGTESTAPVIALSQSSYDFGLISTSTTIPEPITITNTGKSALTGMNITSDNANFTVSVAENATEIAANGGTATFSVTMTPNATGAQSATITVKSNNADELTFTVTGAVAKEGTTVVDFNDNALPVNWVNSTSPTWSFTDGKAVAPSGSWGTYATLTSPKLSLANDDFLAIKVKANSSSYGHLKVFTSTDGSTFSSTAAKEVSYTDLSTEDYKSIVVTGLSSAVKAIRIEGYQVTVDEIAGLTYAPVLTVKQGDAVVTTPAAYAFGELGANQTVTYNLNNTGSGTINITNVESSNTVFTTNWTESVAASNYDLVITANYNAEKAGEQNGAITVTTTDGEFVIDLTSTFLAADAPKFALLIGETEQTTGADLGFGVITENATKEFVFKNDGTGALKVTAITLPDADYTTDLEVAPTQENPLVIAAGTTKVIKVTLAATTKAIKTGNIVISAENFEDFTFAANATVLPGAAVVDFAGNNLPDNWTSTGTWTYDTGAAYSKTNNETDLIISPKLQFTENDFIVLKVKGGDNSTSNFVSVRTSTDNGATWTTLKKINQSSTTFTETEFSTIVVDGISSSVNKIAIASYWVYVDDIAGLTIDANDPKIAVTDAKNAAVTSGTAKDFGWTKTAQTATYYIKNSGTGTLTISSISEVEGFTAATAGNATTVTTEPLALTITMAADAEGAKSGKFTITTDGGNFEIPVSGFVYGDKNFIDFTAEGAKNPAGWSMGNWAISNNQLVSGTSSTSMTTTSFTAAKGEKLYVEAISTSTSSYYTPALTYAIGDEAAKSIVDGLSSSASKVIEIDAFSSIEGEDTTVTLTFAGQYVAIRHIYGLTAVSEPILTTTATDIAFGMQTAESEEQSFTISNEGTAQLEELLVQLGKGNGAEYSISMFVGDTDEPFTGNELTPGQTITIKVKQLYDPSNLGAKSDVLTIRAKGQNTVTINLTGATRDASKMYVDFEDGNIPDGWTKNTWSVTTTSGNKVAYAGFTASSLTTSPLTVTDGEVLTFKAARQYANSTPTLQVRYTTNGGVTWTEYQDLASQVTSSDFATITLSGVPAGTAVVEFYGRYFYLDEISGFAPATGAMIALAEGTTAVANGDTKAFGDLTAAGTATYTLTNSGNADMVTTVATTGVATAAITGEGEGITIAESTVTLAAGKSATITLTVPFEAPYGEKSGAMTLTTEGWVGDFTVNYTATTIDPTALYVDFADNAKPAGWYNGSWTFTSGYAYNYNTTAAEFITQKLTVSGTSDALTYKVAQYSSYSSSAALTVEYSTDRKNWTAASVQPSELTTDFQSFTLSGLNAGDYYVRFTGSQVKLDDIAGWHKTAGIEHDLYIASDNLPLDAVVPGSEYTATINVASLRADETVSVGLWMQKAGEEAIEVKRLTEQSIALNETKQFTLTGNMPDAEGTYQIWANVWNSNNDDDLTTKYNIEVAHIRTLEITEFTKESPTEDVTADENNQFDAEFTVTVKNTGSVELAANEVSASILLGATDGEVQLTKTADAALAVDGTVQLTLTGKVGAGAGGAVSFYAKENLSNTVFATTQTATVTAQAALFAINTDGSEQDFGLVTIGNEAKKTYTVTNNGTKLMNVSIAAPEGFSCEVINTSNSIKFTNNLNWGTVKAYAWDSNQTALTASWPGDAIAQTATNEFNQGVYTFIIPDNAVGIVFNDGGNGQQTVNITDLEQEGYYITGSDKSDGEGHYYVTAWPASSNKSMTIAAGETGQFSVVMNTEAAGKKSGTITLTTNAADVASFEIPVKGRVIAADTWTENFDTEIPASWTNNGWTLDEGVAYSGGYAIEQTLMTPRLAANEGDVLTYDATFKYSGYTLKVEYSTDKNTWTEVETIEYAEAGEHSFTAPENGNYYLRFTGTRYAQLDNFVGFKLNPLDHEIEVASSNIPVTATQYANYTATVTVKEHAGKNESVKAELYVDGVMKADLVQDVEANSTKAFELTFTPEEATNGSVEVYVKITYAESLNLETAKADLTIAAAYTLDEKSTAEVVNSSYDALVLKRTFEKGWNTICLPFDIDNVEAFLGEGAKAYAYGSYEAATQENFYVYNVVKLTPVTELAKGAAYMVELPAAISEPIKLQNVEIEYAYTTPNTLNSTAGLQGFYAPQDAEALAGKYVVTTDRKLKAATTDTTLDGFRAYMVLPQSEKETIFIIGNEDIPTGINSIESEVELGRAYNVNGQRVTELKKGKLYIINGKKVVK